MKKRLLTLLLVAGIAAAAYYIYSRPPAALVLTGIVTTHEVVVSPQIGGKIDQLLVAEGDQVKKAQLLAVITPDELMAESAFYEQSAAGLSSQVHESEAALRFQERQTIDQIRQAESTLTWRTRA
jgi:multidrug efflux pump subunit AcrA (membrane-fusion protein)